MAQQEYNVIQSLFGFTPQNVQRQELEAASDRAMELAKLSARTGGAPASLFYGLEGAERAAVRPIFGPSQQAQQAGTLQSIIQQVQGQGVDISSPDGQIVLAQSLSQNPEFLGIATALRQQAAKTGLEQEFKVSQIAENLSKAAKAGSEKLSEQLTTEYTSLLTEEAAGTLVDPAKQSRLKALKTYFREKAPKGVEVKPSAEESEEQKEVGKGAGANYTKVTITDPQASEVKMRAIRELQVLAGQVDTGTFAEAKAKAQALFKDLGVNIGDPTDAQTLRAAIERGVAQSQLEQKGVQTDRDANRYRQAGVLLSNTPAANQYIIDYQIAIDQRTKEKARFFENFRKENKTSVGAEFAWNESIRDKDIFDSPSLSKYKEAFTMRDIAIKVRNGTASQAEKDQLKALMNKFGIKSVKID